MASIQEREGRKPRIIRWIYEVGASGERTRKPLYLTCVSRAHADELLQAYERAEARGEADTWWERERQRFHAANVTISIFRVGLDWVQRGRAEATRRHRRVHLKALHRWRKTEDLGDLATSSLTMTVVEDYAKWLAHRVQDGALCATTAYYYVQALLQIWRFAASQGEKYPGTPRPPATLADLGIDPPPRPVAMAAPTWDDVDAMLAHLHKDWHRRAVIIMRYTGCRVSQALNLLWGDVDLDAGRFTLRHDLLGSKGKPDRVLPLHPDLQRRMREWGPGEDDALVVPGRKREDGSIVPRTSRTLADPERRAWKAAGIDPRKWGKAGSRGVGRPAHCFRAAFKSGLLRAGGLDSDVDYLIGHARGQTDAAYVDQSEGGPLWDRARSVVALVPSIREGGPEPEAAPAAVAAGEGGPVGEADGGTADIGEAGDVDLDTGSGGGDCDGGAVHGEVGEPRQPGGPNLVLLPGGRLR